MKYKNTIAMLIILAAWYCLIGMAMVLMRSNPSFRRMHDAMQFALVLIVWGLISALITWPAMRVFKFINK